MILRMLSNLRLIKKSLPLPSRQKNRLCLVKNPYLPLAKYRMLSFCVLRSVNLNYLVTPNPGSFRGLLTSSGLRRFAAELSPFYFPNRVHR